MTLQNQFVSLAIIPHRYTGDHIVWVGPWQDFTFDPIYQKLKVVQKQMIYHLKPLIVGF